MPAYCTSRPHSPPGVKCSSACFLQLASLRLTPARRVPPSTARRCCRRRQPSSEPAPQRQSAQSLSIFHFEHTSKTCGRVRTAQCSELAEAPVSGSTLAIMPMHLLAPKRPWLPARRRRHGRGTMRVTFFVRHGSRLECVAASHALGQATTTRARVTVERRSATRSSCFTHQDHVPWYPLASKTTPALSRACIIWRRIAPSTGSTAPCLVPEQRACRPTLFGTPTLRARPGRPTPPSGCGY